MKANISNYFVEFPVATEGMKKLISIEIISAWIFDREITKVCFSRVSGQKESIFNVSIPFFVVLGAWQAIDRKIKEI